MPPRPLRECRHPACHALTNAPGYVCEKHKAWAEEREKAQLAAARKKADAQRESAYSRGYDSAWRKARAAYLRKHPICVSCGRPAIIVDHIIPHKGDKDLFWDSKNWQQLCKRCHVKKTARGE